MAADSGGKGTVKTASGKFRTPRLTDAQRRDRQAFRNINRELGIKSGRRSRVSEGDDPF